MTYTVRYAHLATLPPVIMGGNVNRGQCIGRMGSTGKSTGPHVHIDCVHGRISAVYRQSDMTNLILLAALDQLVYFIDDEMFKCPLSITSGVADIDYFIDHKKVHMGFDVVPANRHTKDENFNIFWNRSKPGEVIAMGYDDGYGNYCNIAFDA